MKKNLLLLFTTLLANISLAQQPAPIIWGSAPQTNDIYPTDTTTWLAGLSISPVITGSIVDGWTGLAYDPTTYKTFGVAKINFSRYLCEINLTAGTATVIGDLLDNFSSITFHENGQLYGATGDGASVSEGFHIINKATASNTLVFTMGNGADGEVICFNRYDNKFYHWSGNGTVVYENWPATNTAYSPSNIATSGNTSSETMGALCLAPNDFIVSTISAEFQHLSSGGFYGNPLSSNPDILRGIIMPPRFARSTNTICASSGTFALWSNCLQLFDSVYYYWGDGNVSQLLASSSSTAPVIHAYSTPGTYTVTVQLYNGVVPKSAFTTYTVYVSTSPVVSISGGTVICPGQTLTLTGSGGGSSQWYNAGVAIPGATLATLAVTSPGWYNMLKINQNGCSDSAAVAVQVVAGQAPTVTASSGSICAGQLFNLNPAGAGNYTISGGSATVNPVITTTYTVVGSGTAGCNSAPVTVTVTVNPTPTITVSSSNATICTGESAVLTATGAAQYQWQFAGTSNTLAVSPSVTTTYVVAGNGAAGCSSTVSIVQHVSDCLGINEQNISQRIMVMPNPSAGHFMISNMALNSVVEVIDLTGQVIFNGRATSQSMELDLTTTSAGVYFIRVSNDKQFQPPVRIIKE